MIHHSAHSLPAPNRQCEVCSAPFYASPGHVAQRWGRFCSMACRSGAWTGAGNPRYGGPVGDRTCETCGKEFRMRPSHVFEGEGKFCSKECQHVDHRQVERVCERCAKPFMVYPSRHDGGRFCSTVCAGNSRRQRQTAVCLRCGKSFEKKPSWFKKHKKGSGSFCGIQCKAAAMSSSPLTTSGINRLGRRGGKREDLGNLYVRSTWEANYARYLNWLQAHGEILSWEFEPDTFEFHRIKKGTRFYTPDFKVTNKDGSVEYHEVKGWMNPASKTKLARMARYYPDVKIVLIDGPVYRTLAKQLRGLIPTWEAA